ncbi:hypothetical protein [Mycobacteroides abscessus]|uniref:hypothetical protein n=2 Tax=Mycobacteroides abscessus TaxID=36809 RepID=UPI000928EDE3|nr:hypothetical protein [Mycobacteroides abscessus]MDO3103906.1 hypothetical protein [Mycobacteroides abscessus subsp. abscessus]MDO3338736.1 hypothetical protein [Mycobacteroides abscessus subsp. abscessus]QOF27057.1 hypothetical protein E3G43_000585 [Mycobacteroides abscessus]RIQ97237.1 hypothetical protein D2E35_22755 [Mycobacteroides abscessus]RIR37724.1 hypothetical protein D2E38_09385 [Mycobacteroides abscessus]
MEAADAIARVVDHIRSRNIDYPTSGLRADKFAGGWSVYAPVEIDTDDPMAFLDMPVGRSVFLVGGSGRIDEVNSSVPPEVARQQFTERETAVGDHSQTSSGDAEAISREASRLIEPIVQQLALQGPPGWEYFTALFSIAGEAQVAQLRFFTPNGSTVVPVPASIAELAVKHRAVAAKLPAGPWWRMLLEVTDTGQLTEKYDYGDEPFPADQLFRPADYRADIARYPRQHLPVWLAAYIAGAEAQGRPSHHASESARSDAAEGIAAVETDDIVPLPEAWLRWAILAALCAGIRTEFGPLIRPASAMFEDGQRNGSTLFVLPGDRAVLSGGMWNSPLLTHAYNDHAGLPNLYAGAPEWVNDSVLNSRREVGLLSFCYWWHGGRWYRGSADTFHELDYPVPPIWTEDETLNAMVAVTSESHRDGCRALMAAANNRSATKAQLLQLLGEDADIDAAFTQLSIAGLTSE